jgi:hypothetical protein
MVPRLPVKRRSSFRPIVCTGLFDIPFTLRLSELSAVPIAVSRSDGLGEFVTAKSQRFVIARCYDSAARRELAW